MGGFFRRNNSAALAFLVAGSFWFVVGTIYGLLAAIHLLAPEFFNNIPWLVFSRIRPVHVNTVLFGFVTATLIGAGLYYTPALLKTKLWSEPLGWLSWLFWNITVLSGPFTFSAGYSQGREYAEYLWIFDVTFVISLLLLVLNLIMTLVNRREKTLYVAVWYFVATFLWTSGVYPIGNVMWNPGTGAMSGIVDSIFVWFYGHNLPGLLLTPLAVGAAYYVIPRITRTPLYSHALSLVGFWTLVALYSHIGGHHIIQSPIPNWLKTVSVINSVAMVVPVFTVLVNLWLSMRGVMGRVLRDPAGLYVFAGTVWYFFTCIQGPVQSLPVMQEVTHFNNWTVGHAHIAVLGFSGYIALGALWYVLPCVTNRALYSRRLVFLQFLLVTTGLTGFFIVLSIAGLIQGGAWHNGEIIYRVLPEIAVYMGMRAALGISIMTAAFIGLYNVIMTIRSGELIPEPADEEDI